MQLTNLKDKISYIIGRDMAANLQKQGIEVEAEAFVQGMKEAMSGKPSVLSQAEVQQAMMAFQQEVGVLDERRNQEVMALY